MYLIKVKGKPSEWTIPKENIIPLAMVRAMDLKRAVAIRNNEQAIKFLNEIGIIVEDYKEV